MVEHKGQLVTFKEMLGSPEMRRQTSKLAVPLGVDLHGNKVIGDIAKFPHVLIAGSTGSGKSTLIHTWISTLLMRTSPKEVQMILIDPKQVEFSIYRRIPHLLYPVIVEMDRALSSFEWALTEMERRYYQFAEAGVRDIEGYNKITKSQAFPYIIIIVDEFSDLMANLPKVFEDVVSRIAQIARPTGIHMVLSTSRPSTDVYTRKILANVPTRIAGNLSTKEDSRWIIGTDGAETLKGKGDMLYWPFNEKNTIHIQGVCITENEIEKIINSPTDRYVYH
jgi:DNA segregation ATPase FtsK/SpoIIIE, S-DNA-T family